MGSSGQQGSFAWALEQMKNNNPVFRMGWTGETSYIYIAKERQNIDVAVEFIQLKFVDHCGDLQTNDQLSMEDLEANDWVVETSPFLSNGENGDSEK